MNGAAARIAPMLALLVWSVLAAQTRSFMFAGLSLKTTMADLKQRYPRSMFVDTLVYVSGKESHDGISTIGLSDNGRVRAIAITFERQDDNRPTYPACEKVLAVLTKQYGKTANVVDGQEEQSRNRRFAWKNSAESLTLSCFQVSQQPLYAERLTIASGP